MTEVFILYKNVDQCEGRGPEVPMAVFASEEDAEKTREMQGIYFIGSVRKIGYYYTYRDYEDNTSKNTLIKNALAKLTPEEKKLLGLDK